MVSPVFIWGIIWWFSTRYNPEMREIKPSLMLQRYYSLFRLVLFHPGLARLAWNLKRDKKTFLTFTTLYSLVKNYLTVVNRDEGTIQLAEFGVGRGGSAILLAWMVDRYGGSLTLFDVFGRIPSPTERDGERAQERYQFILNRESENYYGNIPNLLDLIRQEIAEVCDLQKVVFVQGKYEDTLPELEDGSSFNLVHIDCDWYESSKAVLDYLEDKLKPGAIIQVDDYSNWQGSHNAIEEAQWLKGYRRWIVDGALVIDTGHPSIS